MSNVRKTGTAFLALAALLMVLAGCSKGGGGNVGDAGNLEKSQVLDVSGVKSADGQVLMPPLSSKQIPPRPADPNALPEEDAMHWYDMEYAGWNAGDKVNPAASPGNGSIGKYVIVIVHGDHPWTTAYMNGAKKAAEALGMKIDLWSPNWDVNVQNQMIDQAINAKPDAIGVIPINAESAVQQFRRINQAGIPAFGTNTLTTSEAMRYMVTWTGPDDWGQMRKLARHLADAMGKTGGICYVTHNPGGSPYFARMFGPRTELQTYAPDIKTLDFQSPGFDAPATKQVVADWITRYGQDLKAIFLADDAPQAIGTIDAIKEAKRTDILVVAAGNSKQGMDLVTSGDLLAINYQTAEGDGAACVKSMGDFFNGKKLPELGYLAQDIITKENVAAFQPPQW
ncbi:MAG: sugar ABC transporter substrate-binding protein [Treponema sp.]|jgi:ribose transport system substrate-binding protein|nr:sugar ABC transporter substrate-binding protein [Treponema sp.]